MNFGRQKNNPWRNTRRDFSMPWNDIWAAVFMAVLPIVVIVFAMNITLRSSTFYSFFMSKTEMIREIPYRVASEDIVNTFGNFMMHKSDKFVLIEKNDYQPQQVFTERAGDIMESIRGILDVSLILGIVLLIVSVVIVVYLHSQKEKRLIHESFKNSWIWFGVLSAVSLITVLVSPVRDLIFRVLYGVNFEPGDVLIQLFFDSSLPVYYAVAELLVAVLLMGCVTYLVERLFGNHKMFKVR